MKKYLLTPILTTLFSVPAFSAFPGADMNNTNIEGKTTSSNMQIQYNDKQNKKHSGNDKNATTDLNSEKVPLQHRQARDAQEANSDRHESNHRPQPKHHKKLKHNQQVLAHDNQKDVDDENDNLKNIARPETNNINSNLRIPDGEASRLNREMMLDGPQGGFQNNQPRGISNS